MRDIALFPQGLNIVQAQTVAQVAEARALFEEYAGWLDVDLCFQGFAVELNTLPGRYALPRGRLLLALNGQDVAGCVALRPIGDTRCEMKRLYVRPAFQGMGIGRLLAERIVHEARAMGYAAMNLDTLPQMQSAIALYEALGFVRSEAYYETPLAGTIFMTMRL